MPLFFYPLLTSTILHICSDPNSSQYALLSHFLNKLYNTIANAGSVAYV